MGFRKHLVNGIVSTVISVGVTAMQAEGDEWTTKELLLSVAVSAFLSGFFTSYFAG
jgi:ABC-type transport system involved in cytochrome c biogenesis permease subunit